MNKESRKIMDLRGKSGNFFPAIKKHASLLKEGEEFEIIQTFEPYPLYEAMKNMGFSFETKNPSKGEYHVIFTRETISDNEGAPFKPVALLNYPLIDEELGETAVEFWNITWNSKNRTIPYKYRLLLSLTNAVGAGRMRQASRELIKAYSSGVTSKEFDDIFELLAWNQGIGYFSSEIGPSTLFRAYKMIKTMEKQNKDREIIIEKLMESFGENNPLVSVK